MILQDCIRKLLLIAQEIDIATHNCGVVFLRNGILKTLFSLETNVYKV